jgi:ABC-2 type transport system permease protein
MTPIGWYQSMHAYSGERWWPFLLILGFTAVVGAAAFVAFEHRDTGSGLWAARPGPDTASRSLGSGGLGLAWRLQRPSLYGWALGLFLAGVSYGTIGDDVSALLGDSELSRDFFGGGAEVALDAFFAFATIQLSVMAAGFTISSALRPRGEEDQERLEPLLATGLSRRRWLLGHVSVTVGGTLTTMAALGVGFAVGYGAVTGKWDRLGDLTAASLVLVPGVLMLGAVALLLHGWVPRWAVLAWVGLVYCAFVQFFGELLDLPQWALDLSPISHMGTYPAGSVDWTGFTVVLGLATLAGVLGMWGFLRRDVC